MTAPWLDTAETAERATTAAGRWAAAETSSGAFSAVASSGIAAASSSPVTTRLQEVSGRGRTLTLISVRTERVPKAPAWSLPMS